MTLKVQPHVWNLRARRTFTRIVAALGAASDRFGMGIAHFSVQSDHAHLIIEAEDRNAIVRGIKGLCVRIARAINGMMVRKGSVFADRYHDRVLTTPVRRATRSHMCCNARKHGLAPRSPGWLDPCSSAASFGGWNREVGDTALPTTLVVPARTWLLRVGWMRAAHTVHR